MAGSKAGAAKMKQTMIDRFGSEEAWREAMRNNGSKGGKRSSNLLGNAGGFAVNRELAREAGKVGGTISRRKPCNA